MICNHQLCQPDNFEWQASEEEVEEESEEEEEPAGAARLEVEGALALLHYL